MILFSLMAHANSFMPVEGTDVATKVDSLYSFMVWTSFIACVLVIGGFVYFAFKYRRKTPNDKTAYISHNGLLEFLWSFIPFVFFMVFFAWGWYVYHDLRTPPSGAFEIRVDGQKWFWTFSYKSGRKSAGELYVPVNTDVKLIMSSRDVIHSFYIPAFRTKQDVVPGMYSQIWFNANKEGTFQVFCTEYCGDQHSGMLAKVHVLSKEKFEKWLQENPYKGLTIAQIGQKVYDTKCAICHTTTHEKKVGPGWQGVIGSEREFADGSKAVADENYIRESILNPNAKIVAGYTPAMPTFLGQLSEDELAGVIEFIKSLK